MPQFYYITGCDSGFGAEAVRMLAEQKKNVFAGHFMPDSAAKLEAVGKGYVTPIQVDVTNDESVTAAADKIKEHMKKNGGYLAGLVNNAGLLFQNGPCEWTPIGNWKRMFEVNVFGMVRVTNSVLPLIRKSEGRIVNTASIAGRVGFACQGAYCATKHAVEGYSDSLRREMYQWGVSVHIVEPGVFPQTGLYQTYYDGLEKLWANLSPEVQRDYGVELKQDLQTQGGAIIAKTGERNTDPSVVPQAYLHALTSPKPEYRYRVGVDSKYLITFLTWLHESWADMVGRTRTVLPKASSVAAQNRAIGRYTGWTIARRLIFFLVVRAVFKALQKRL